MFKHLLTSSCASALLIGTAAAADLPRRVAPPPIFTPVPVFTWTGFYGGFHAGYAFGDKKRTLTTVVDPLDFVTPAYLTALGTDSVRQNRSGFTGGGQIGYNYQFTPGSGFVIGVEADASYVDFQSRRRSTATIVGFPDFPGVNDINLDNSTRNDLEFLGTVRGRLGYAFDRFLVYGTGGFAYGQVNYRSVTNIGLTLGGVPSGPTQNIVGGFKEFQTGYAYGGGLEYALSADSFLNFLRASAVTFKVEYLHFDLGSTNVVGFYDIIPSSGTLTPVTSTKVKTEGDIVRAGINYKFGTY